MGIVTVLLATSLLLVITYTVDNNECTAKLALLFTKRRSGMLLCDYRVISSVVDVI